MTEFEIFSEKIEKAVGSKICKEQEVVVRPVIKLNGVIQHGMSIKSPDRKVVPTVYLEDFYEFYKEGTALANIVDRIYEVLTNNSVSDEIDVDFFSDYKRVRGMLGIKLINAKANERLLEDIPHKIYLDLAIVCYVAVRDQSIGCGSILVHNNHIMMWGVGANELLFDALENVSRIEPGRMIRITDILREMVDVDRQLQDAGLEEKDCEMFVLTNESRLYGASVMMYKGMLESIAETLQCDYYIIPSSVHEVLVLPEYATPDYRALNYMVQDVNSTQLTPVEILSDHVYRYSYSEKQLLPC